MTSKLPNTLSFQSLSLPSQSEIPQIQTNPNPSNLQTDQSIDLSIIQAPSESPDSQSKARLIGRICTLFIVIAALLFGRNSVPDNEIDCVIDKLQIALDSFNKALQQPQYALLTKSLVASCSIMCDIVFIGTFIYWILHGKSLRLPIVIGVFTIVRLAVLCVWHSPMPAGYLWERSEIPSLVVTFEDGDGFFYSKYLGYMIICAKELGNQGKCWMKRGILIGCVYLVVMSLVLRGGYTIDLFTGAVFGIWFYERVGWYVENVDAKWRSWMREVEKMMNCCNWGK